MSKLETVDWGPLRAMGISFREQDRAEWSDLLKTGEDAFMLIRAGVFTSVAEVVSVVEDFIVFCGDDIDGRVCIETGVSEFSKRAAAAVSNLCVARGFGIYSMPPIRTVIFSAGMPVGLEWELVRARGEWARVLVEVDPDARGFVKRAAVLAAAVGREDDPARWSTPI